MANHGYARRARQALALVAVACRSDETAVSAAPAEPVAEGEVAPYEPTLPANDWEAPGAAGVGEGWESPKAGKLVRIEDGALRIDAQADGNVQACESDTTAVPSRFRVVGQWRWSGVAATEWWQGAKLNATFYDADGKRIPGREGVVPVQRVVGDQADFVRVEGLVEAPEGAVSASLCVGLYKAATGTLWVKNLGIVPPPPAKSRPNVLMVVVDTLRADALGIYGNDRGASPNLDRWAQGALVFDKAWAQYTWTNPSFVSYMTSRYARTHGWSYEFKEWEQQTELDRRAPSLAEVLQGNGYLTTGRCSNAYIRKDLGMARGFNEWTTTRDDRMLETATEDIAKWSGSGYPNLLYVHLMSAHVPLEPSVEGRKAVGARELGEGRITYNDDKGATDYGLFQDAYLASVWDADRIVGQLLDTLEAAGHTDDTLVVYYADHGELLGEHDVLGHGPWLYEGLTHVPLVLKGPGVAPGRVGDRMAELIDIAPTVLDVVGLRDAQPPQWQGHSLLGQDPYAVAVSERGPSVVFRNPDGLKIFEAQQDGSLSAMYDLDEDPGELNSLAAAAPAGTEALVDAAEAWRKRTPVGTNAGARPELSEEEKADHLAELKALGYIE